LTYQGLRTAIVWTAEAAALVTRVATLPRDAAFGTELTPPRRRRMSAFKGEAVMSLYLSLVLN
jgi:hypothetical protein